MRGDGYNLGVQLDSRYNCLVEVILISIINLYCLSYWKAFLVLNKTKVMFLCILYRGYAQSYLMLFCVFKKKSNICKRTLYVEWNGENLNFVDKSYFSGIPCLMKPTPVEKHLNRTTCGGFTWFMVFVFFFIRESCFTTYCGVAKCWKIWA